MSPVYREIRSNGSRDPVTHAAALSFRRKDGSVAHNRNNPSNITEWQCNSNCLANCHGLFFQEVVHSAQPLVLGFGFELLQVRPLPSSRNNLF